MRIAFYSPIAKPPEDPCGITLYPSAFRPSVEQILGDEPSGVARIRTLLVEKLLLAGSTAIHIPRLPRCFEPKGDSTRQQQLRAEAEAAADGYLKAMAERHVPCP